jgi:hypothetical protein
METLIVNGDVARGRAGAEGRCDNVVNSATLSDEFATGKIPLK